GDLLGQVPQRHGGGHIGDVADLPGEIGGHGVDVVGQVLPGAGDAAYLRLAAELAVGPDFACDPRHFRGERVELIDHRVDHVLDLQDLAACIDRDLLGEVARRDGRRHLGHVAQLDGQVACHGIDVV